MNPEQPNNLQHSILQAIKHGEIKPHTKRYFVLRALMLASGVFLATCIVLFLVSFIVFSLRQSNPANARAVFLALPWLIIGIVLLGLGLLEFLLRNYEFSYKRPLVYSLAVLVAIVAIGGILIERVHFHEALLERARLNHLPVGGPFYRHYDPRHGRPFPSHMPQPTAREIIIRELR